MDSQEVQDHFERPRNAGAIDDPDGVGTHGSPAGGPFIQIFVKVRSDLLEDVSFKTFACGHTIACCSKLTEMVKGKSIEDARQVAPEELLEAVGGLPLGKQHCPGMAISALRQAIAAACGGPPDS